MKLLLASFVAGATLTAAGVSNAGTFVSTGPVSVEAYMSVSQALPFNPCDFTVSGAIVSGSSLVTTSGATPSSPSPICNIAGFPISLTEEISIDDIGHSGTVLNIRNITANSIVGTCGPGTVTGRVSSYGPDLVIVIDPDPQNIPGWSLLPPPPYPLDCWISGTIVVRNVQYVP